MNNMDNLLNFAGKPLIYPCDAIALFINADGFRRKDGQPYTGDDIFRSNSHGELFGVISAIRFLEEIGKADEMQDIITEMKDALAAIHRGEKTSILDKYTGIGKACCEFLWQCSWVKD